MKDNGSSSQRVLGDYQQLKAVAAGSSDISRIYGGEMPGGLPRPNAQPSTQPDLGW